MSVSAVSFLRMAHVAAVHMPPKRKKRRKDDSTGLGVMKREVHSDGIIYKERFLGYAKLAYVLCVRACEKKKMLEQKELKKKKKKITTQETINLTERRTAGVNKAEDFSWNWRGERGSA